MKIFTLLFSLFFLVCACNNKNSEITGANKELTLNNQSVSTKSLSQKTNTVVSNPDNDLGVGPIKQKIDLKAINTEMADQGKEIFQSKCSACHRIFEKYVGPALADVTKRRSPEWIMNMVLNPVEMTQVNPIAQSLLAEYLTQMTFQNVTEQEVRKILEYFRQSDFEIEAKRKAEIEVKSKLK